MRVGPGVLTDAGDLPGNFHSRLTGLDGKAAIIGDFRCDDGLRELADHGELIAKICVESLEPRGHGDDGCAAAIGDDVAVVDVHHVGRFDEGMVEILSRRVERMIDFERAAGLGKSSKNFHITVEIAGKGIGPVAAHGVDTISINSPSPGARKGSDAVTPFDAVASDGRYAGAATARHACGVTSISCDATPSPIVNASAITPKCMDAGPASADRGRRGAVGRTTIRGNSRTSHEGAGGRLRAVTGDRGMIRRGVCDVQDRDTGARSAPTKRQGNLARRTRSPRSAGGALWTRCARRTGRTLRADRSYRHIG